MFLKPIHDLLAQALKQQNIDESTLHIEVPSDAQFGDYSTNIALLHAKNRKMNPMDLAQKIIDSIPTNDTIEQAQAIKPGFINIFLKPNLLVNVLNDSSSDADTFKSSITGKSFTVEFTDPNPFKEFHIGHLYSNTAGEAISRLLEATGVKVRRVNYQGDVGIHVACSVWGMIYQMQNSNIKIQNENIANLADIEKLPLAERVRWLGQCYAQGATAYKEDEKVKEDIKSLNAQIFMAAQTMWKRERTDFESHVHYEKLISREVFSQDLVQEYYGERKTLDSRIFRDYI